METPELNAIDRHLAGFLQRLARRESPELELAVQLLSNSQADGHVCLPLREVKADSLTNAGINQSLPRQETWAKRLRESGIVGEPGEFKPLILDESERLYLQRYWKYESKLAGNLQARLRQRHGIQTKLPQAIRELFPRAAQMQKLAGVVAATSNLCVISGAPGTGKTHTIVLICALMLQLRAETRIALAAPTGKAAARLKESLEQARTRAQVPGELAARLPRDASTIQRLLGVRRDSGKFRHDAANPLEYDAIIVDEASMIDLALLAKLFDAIRPDARVILVGDKDQLASVEAGSAFRDICTPGTELRVSGNQARAVAEITGEKIEDTMPQRAPIHDAIVELRENFRFRAGEGIAELSAAINRGDAPAALEGLKRSGQVHLRTTPSIKNLPRALRQDVLPRFHAMLRMNEPQQALAALGKFAVLCALRRGPFGAEAINSALEKMLRETGASDREATYFHGQPLMILRNDYNTDLFNGDIGVVLKSGDEHRVFFPGESGELRSFSPARLPEHTTAFALTVHKSQGSEFDQCVLILPDADSPVLTRELLYTAVTRVRDGVEIWANEAVLEQTIARQVRRSSGLRDALWGSAT